MTRLVEFVNNCAQYDPCTAVGPMAGETSIRLKQQKEKILCLWEERCLKKVASAGTVTSLALRDSIPKYLDHLSDALATSRRMDFKSIGAHDDESARIGKRHGADRADSRSYGLGEVIFEYHILREVIFEVLESDGALEPGPRDIIYDSLEQAMTDAAVEFSSLHTEIQQTFVNILTHDLKTPITGAKMNADLILRRPDVPAPVAVFVRKIVASLNRLNSMIHDLLDTSRIRAGEPLSLKMVECDLDTLMRGVIEEMAVIHGDRFAVDSKEAVEGKWGCDGLRRALENLVGNAVKYSPPHTPVKVSLRRTSDGAELAVHNEGPAIDKKEIPLLFQKYRRAKIAQEGTKTGWGLGLTLVKGVVDAHAGRVHVESVIDKGTTFTLEIPSMNQ